MKFHAEREALTLELHERPFQPMTAPLRVSHMALGTGEHGADQDQDQLFALCRHYGKPEPQKGVKHFIADLGPFTVKWERHTEFSTYMFLREEPFDAPFEETVLDLLPKEWVKGLFGEVLVAQHLSVSTDLGAELDENRLSRWFSGNSVFANRVGDGWADIHGDLRTHDDGFERILVRTSGDTEERVLGQLVQRVLEAVTYSRLSLLSLPIARQSSPRLAEIERGLARIARDLAEKGADGQDQQRLEQLSKLSAELEDEVATSSYRYSASTAYFEIVEHRLRDLAPTTIDGQIDLFGYLMRRLDPAMRTCQSVAARQEALSRRANRLSSLLQTGIEVRLEAQNGELLLSMNRRADQAIKLQRTVEGLSVIAVSYYAISLLKYVFTGLYDAGSLPVDPDIATALSAPVVILGLWALLRRLTREVMSGEDQ